jgi:hypothetical protein
MGKLIKTEWAFERLHDPFLEIINAPSTEEYVSMNIDKETFDYPLLRLLGFPGVQASCSKELVTS